MRALSFGSGLLSLCCLSFDVRRQVEKQKSTEIVGGIKAAFQVERQRSNSLINTSQLRQRAATYLPACSRRLDANSLDDNNLVLPYFVLERERETGREGERVLLYNNKQLLQTPTQLADYVLLMVRNMRVRSGNLEIASRLFLATTAPAQALV